MSGRSALVVMARYPTTGAVKTRLGGSIGMECACALYRAFIDDLDARFGGTRRELVWAYTPPEADFTAIVGAGRRCMPQAGDDLGARMLHAFRTLCDDGFNTVIMIGADVPHVRDAWLDEAEAALDVADVVFGPSDDGGYYLVAMRRPHDVFSGIEMSTPQVLTATLRKAADLRLRVQLLPQSFDVDEIKDLERLREELARADVGLCLPRTSALLRDLKGGRS